MFKRRRHFLSADAEQWQFDCWQWHLSQNGVAEQLVKTPLVRPNKEYFPALGLEGHARAEAIFDLVKKHAAMEEWPVSLVAQHDMPAFLDGGAFIKHESSCAGTFRFNDSDEAIITYAPDLIGNPIGLIATLAHELGHYLNETFDCAPPGGDALNEPATDVTSILLGFGIFTANDGLVHNTFDHGFQVGKVGYLSEDERIFSLAIFLSLTGRDAEEATPYLKKYLAKALVGASKYLKQNDLLSRFKDLDHE